MNEETQLVKELAFFSLRIPTTTLPSGKPELAEAVKVTLHAASVIARAKPEAIQ
jgi:hypothetical protein